MHSGKPVSWQAQMARRHGERMQYELGVVVSWQALEEQL